MSPIEHVWGFVGRCLARDVRPAASKDELLLCIQAMWNSLLQADIQNLFDSLPSRIAALIAARVLAVLLKRRSFCTICRFGNHGLNTVILTPAALFRAILTEQTLIISTPLEITLTTRKWPTFPPTWNWN
ncbi:hypothetical protein TNCV_3220291 [Trichonephila clavipes]|nr:hypothetical protein TNCV_3220291 [Trichonephila clavipes]